MLKRILTIWKMDMTASFRDSVALYSLLSPLLLALIIRLIIPTVEDVSITFAVLKNSGPEVISGLEKFGTVEIYEDYNQLIRRVNQNDDVPGIILKDGVYTLILEGNEDPQIGEQYSFYLADALAPPGPPDFIVEDLQNDPVPVKKYAAALMVLISLFVGGIVVGFQIVEEKETKAVMALAVTPLRMIDYILARSMMAFIIPITAGVASSVILLGFHINFGALFLSILISLVVALPFGFIIGGFADNQMTAFALVKLLMAVFITIPFVSIFVPLPWHWIFYVFPNYWMFMTLRCVLVGDTQIGLVVSGILTIVTGLIMTGILFPKMREGLRLR